MPHSEKQKTSDPGAKNSTARIALWLFISFLFFYTLNASGHQYSVDGMLIVAAAESLVLERNFSLDASTGAVSELRINPLVMQNFQGERFSKYSPLNSVLMAPAAALGIKLKRFSPPGADPRFTVYFVCSFFNALVTALTVALLFELCVGLGAGVRPSVAAAAFYGVATIALPYAKMSFSEPMVGLLATACFCGLVYYRRDGRPGALAAAAAAAMLLPLARLTGFVCLIPLGLYAFASRPFWKAPLAIAAGSFAGLFLHGLYNFHRFGSFLETGYGTETYRFTTPIIAGLYGLLVSSDKSIFVYSPPALLGLLGIVVLSRRGKLAEAACIAGVFAVNVLLFATWHRWEGGHSWGPRFLVPTVPLLMAAAAFYIERAAGNRRRAATVAILVAAGITVQFAATTAKFTPNYVNASVKDDIQAAYTEGRLLRPGAPRFLPLRAQLSDAVSHTAYTITHIGGYFSSQKTEYDNLLENKLIENAPDFWPFLVWLSSGWKLRIDVIAITSLTALFFTFSLLRLSAALRYFLCNS